MQSAKEAAANIAASAASGMEKTKATAQEQGEKMTTRDPLKKDIATQKKEERVHEAERQKLAAREQNAAAKHTAAGGGAFTGAGYTAKGGMLGSEYPQVPSQNPAGTGRVPHHASAEGEILDSEYPQVPTGVFGSQNPAGAGRVPHHDPNAGTGYGTGNTY